MLLSSTRNYDGSHRSFSCKSTRTRKEARKAGSRLHLGPLIWPEKDLLLASWRKKGVTGFKKLWSGEGGGGANLVSANSKIGRLKAWGGRGSSKRKLSAQAVLFYLHNGLGELQIGKNCRYELGAGTGAVGPAGGRKTRRRLEERKF